jgi:hypothetical protein
VISSSTVSTDSIPLTAVTEAQGALDGATCDIANALIQTDVRVTDDDGNRTIMKIRGTLVHILHNIVDCVVRKGKIIYVFGDTAKMEGGFDLRNKENYFIPQRGSRCWNTCPTLVQPFVEVSSSCILIHLEMDLSCTCCCIHRCIHYF